MMKLSAIVCLAFHGALATASSGLEEDGSGEQDQAMLQLEETPIPLNETMELVTAGGRWCPEGGPYLCNHPGPFATAKGLTCYDIPSDYSWMGLLSFSIIPLRKDSHCLVMVADSEQQVRGYDDFFAQIRLRNGQFDVRNGGRYAYEERIKATMGQVYDVEAVIDVSSARYDVEVFPRNEGDSGTIANNYRFRTSGSLRSNSGQICTRSPDKWGDCVVANLQVYSSN
eukprot:CAMPEP_0167785352 /NCGR_PEP_ID=MMETSP0111_2-20121227/8186_1 /TAXON_ID=91324 /ORGANISM="Lotharella globosa, Strain CCCM811" /LENGTH=226 /DNA_ID=CAMNT_0007676607 /DNA_START=215 /DNA_END=898 /DNA_ORIENTATION=-